MAPRRSWREGLKDVEPARKEGRSPPGRGHSTGKDLEVGKSSA